MKEQIINLDIYRRSVVILQGSVDELAEWLYDHGVKHLVPSVTDVDWILSKGITFDDGRDVYVCSVESMELTTLCHELSHAALKILKIVGIDPIEAEEAYAYLFEYLVGEVTSSDDAQSLLSQDASQHTP